MNRNTFECIQRVTETGVSLEDAHALRRIAMTLHRWHELECGDGNSYGSWAIERDDNGDGPPFMVHHRYGHGTAKDTVARARIHDREAGALKRLAAIMKRYPTLSAYVQGDPRGASLYILRPGDVPEGANVDSCYSRGIAVYR